MNQTELDFRNTEGPLGSSSQRLLTIGGILLIAGGMLFGDIFAMFVLHPNNARIGEAMFAASQLIPAGDTEGILNHFMAIGGFLENRGTKVDTHSHMIHVGYIALLLAILQPWVALTPTTKRKLAWLYIVSAALLPVSIFSIHYVGLAYSPLSHIGWGSIFADLFGALLSVAVFIQLLGPVALHRRTWRRRQREHPGYPEPGGPHAVGGRPRHCWCGAFLYGAAYAAWLQSGMGLPPLRSPY